MKNFITFAFLLITSFAVKAQNDINFRFFPSASYTMIDVKKVTDSVTNVTTWKSDTLKHDVRSVIEKNDGQLKVFSTTDLTLTHYESKVKFVGVSNDGLHCLVYTGKDGEVIVTNPILGFTVIVFSKNCEDEKAIPPGQAPRCENTFHYFGAVPSGFKF